MKSGTYRDPAPPEGEIQASAAELVEFRPQGINVLRGKSPTGEDFYAAQFLINPHKVISIVLNDEGKSTLIKGFTGGIHVP